jgi:diphosphomevalonate decarboxylase
MKGSRARAHTNIALVKYWGKRVAELNLPAVGSISVTLADLFTETSVVFVDDSERDTFELNGEVVCEERPRIERFLDRVRQRAGITAHARVSSSNNFPTAAGLASSASGFAALTLAATRAAGMRLPAAELSVLARLGSGSAPRSLYGGFSRMSAGTRDDGVDAIAQPLFDESHWPLAVLIAIVSSQRKPIGSREAMELSACSSPYYAAWIDGAEADLRTAEAAIAARDIESLAAVAEFNCLKMHAVATTSRPGVLFWSGATVDIIHAVRSARAAGTPAFFTIDAGPQVKVFCEPHHADRLADVLDSVGGVRQVIRTTIGPAAHVLE